MRLLTLLTTTLTLAATAASAPAQDTVTYALNATKAFEVGDVFTETESSDKQQKIVVTVQGQVVQDKDESTKISFTRVTQVLAVDAKGKRAKSLVYFAKFSHTAGGFEDDTLSGKVIEVVKQADGASRWRHHAGEGNLGPAAKKWLDSKYKADAAKKSKADMDDIMRPQQPVAIGGQWTPDIAALIENMGLPVNAEKTTATCTLVGVETRDGVELAQISFEATFPLDKFPGGPQMEVAWTKGGVMNFSLKGTMPTTARIGATEKTGGYSLEGEAEMQGASVSLSIKEENTEVRTLTGTIPDLPLIPVVAPTVPAPTPVPPADDGGR